MKTPTLRNTDLENRLIKQCLLGNAKAQKQIYTRYAGAMYNVAARIVGDRIEAEDVVQDVFIKVFQQLKQFKGQSTLGAWIKRITVNTALNNLRKHKLLVYSDEMEDQAEEIIESRTTRFSVNEIHHAIKKLPEGSRLVVSLHLIEGYQHQEVASILGISVSTSKSQYHRGKKLLRLGLEKAKCSAKLI